MKCFTYFFPDTKPSKSNVHLTHTAHLNLELRYFKCSVTSWATLVDSVYLYIQLYDHIFINLQIVYKTVFYTLLSFI